MDAADVVARDAPGWPVRARRAGRLRAACVSSRSSSWIELDTIWLETFTRAESMAVSRSSQALSPPIALRSLTRCLPDLRRPVPRSRRSSSSSSGPCSRPSVRRPDLAGRDLPARRNLQADRLARSAVAAGGRARARGRPRSRRPELRRSLLRARARCGARPRPRPRGTVPPRCDMRPRRCRPRPPGRRAERPRRHRRARWCGGSAQITRRRRRRLRGRPRRRRRRGSGSRGRAYRSRT